MAREMAFQEVIIDIEPTEGFGRLIRSIETVSKSILNLSKVGFIKLKAL